MQRQLRWDRAENLHEEAIRRWHWVCWRSVYTFDLSSDLERFQFSLKQGYRQCPESAGGVAGYWRSNINWKRFKVANNKRAALIRLVLTDAQ